MRLLKIGHDASCDIVINSPHVSSLHAEITLMNSGDILLEDKNSRNGTFVMNQRIASGKPVNIRRGDIVKFADVELQWSQVPMPEDNSAYRAVYGIGSNFNNDIQISGNTVSRYHATLKEGKDGKMYIIDHSKNGTTVDGMKIPSNTPVRIKRKSAVVCGGVPVDLSRYFKSNPLMPILTVAASVLVLVGIGFGVWKIFIDSSSKPSLQALQNATARVYGQYYVEVTFKDDPFIGRIPKWPEVWKFGVYNGKLALGTMTSKNISPISFSGTAFFISRNGELGTNRHIACPWEYLTNDQKDMIRQEMQQISTGRNMFLIQNFLNPAISLGLIDVATAQAWFDRLQRSDYEISGSFEYLGVVLAGTSYTTLADLQSCQVIADSKNMERDVALLRLNSRKTPEDIIKHGFYDIEKSRTDERGLKPQEEELTTIGFPAEFGTDVKFVGKGKEEIPIVHRTYISKAPDNDMFQLQSNVVGGQSGSPIVDKDLKLVGVIWGAIRNTDVAFGCNIKHLKELYDMNKVRTEE